MTIYFDVAHDSDLMDYECVSKTEAQEKADAWWASRCQENPARNGYTEEGECEIVEFSINDETGEREEHSRETYELSYEHYHGDEKEHGTYY